MKPITHGSIIEAKSGGARRVYKDRMRIFCDFRQHAAKFLKQFPLAMHAMQEIKALAGEGRRKHRDGDAVPVKLL